MTHLRRIAVLVGFLGTVAPAAWGQVSGTTVPLATNNVLDAYGLTATITSCSATCSGDTLELISSGRDTITIEAINNTPSAILASATSSKNAPAPVALSYTLTFAINPSSKLKGTTVTSAVQTATGSNNCNGSQCPTATGSATLANSHATLATLTDNLLPTSGTTSHSNASNLNTFTGTNSFTVVESLNLSGARTTTDLAFNTLVLKLTTAPEPASISVMLMAIGGLAAARRRRSS